MIKTTDENLRLAWAKYTTEEIRNLPEYTGYMAEVVNAARQRILALREADESNVEQV